MARLRGKVSGHEDTRDALANVDKKPDSAGRQATLKEELAAIQAEQDSDLLNLAQTVLQKLDEKGAEAGKYNITISGGQGFVIGDHAKVEQHFGTKPEK